MTPDTFLKQIKKENLNTFFLAFFLGITVHGFRLTNHLITWDSVFNFHDPQFKADLGRCFLSIGCAVSSYYDVQWIIGLISLVWISLTCILLCKIFNVKSVISRFLLCAITVAFPSVAGTFAYMYTADGYFLGMFLSALSAFYMIKSLDEDSRKDRKYIVFRVLSVICLALSCGMYQAYLAYGCMILLIWCILKLLYDKDVSLGDYVKLFILTALGVVLYFISSRIVIIATKTVVADYNGISKPELSIFSAFKNCIIDTAYFFFGPLSRISLFQVLNVLLFLGILSILIYRIRTIIEDSGADEGKEKVKRISLSIAGIALIPFVSFMIYFISPGVRYYMLMYAPLSLIYIFFILLYEREGIKAAIPSWCITGVLAVICFNFILLDNISYLYMVTDNEKTLQFTNRLAERIESLPDYESAKRLCVTGHFEDYDKIEVILPPAMAGIRDGILLSDSAHFSAALDTYCGISLEPVEHKEINSASPDPAIESAKEDEHINDIAVTMSSWPSEDSIRQEGDMIIVKLN